MTPHDTPPAPVSWDELPPPIRTYLTAHARGETTEALAVFADDAVVTDEGRDHRGRAAIESWLGSSASEYTYTTEFTGATMSGTTSADVVQHLEGDFPGGAADLHFRFTLDDNRISRLVIEP